MRTTNTIPGRGRRRALALIPAWALAVGLASGGLPAQTPEADEPTPAPATSVVAPSPGTGLYVGAASCASSSCHGATGPRNVFDVLQNEYLTWLQLDRHSKAHEVLFNPQSTKIAENLGLSEEPEAAQVCLDCHAFTPPPERVSERVAGDWEVEEGISCEACHGPAGGWLGSHTEEGWTREDGIAAGLVDLSRPERRGELCLSCHRGTGTKSVDHRLIAAGHPQLVFELDNYSASMPAHWRPDPAAEGARGWALGQVVALQVELDRVIEIAEAGQWPELSLMSCSDCHHSLREERWRRPGVRRPLGLPRWSPARWAVLRPLVERFAPDHEARLDRALGRLARTVSRLGSPPTPAAAAARDAREALTDVLPAVQEVEWDEEQILALLAALAADRNRFAAADYDTAEQVSLAVHTLASDLIHRRPQVLRGGLVDANEALHRTVRDPYRFDPSSFATALERLAREVRRLR